MYAYILGVISEIQPTNVVLDNQGIGYLIVTPNPYIYKLGENVKMYKIGRASCRERVKI